MQIDRRVQQAVGELTGYFWEAYEDSTLAFPDTSEGELAEQIVAEMSLITLVMNYISMFEKPARTGVFTKLMSDMYKVELLARDIE